MMTLEEGQTTGKSCSSTVPGKNGRVVLDDDGSVDYELPCAKLEGSSRWYCRIRDIDGSYEWVPFRIGCEIEEYSANRRGRGSDSDVGADGRHLGKSWISPVENVLSRTEKMIDEVDELTVGKSKENGCVQVGSPA